MARVKEFSLLAETARIATATGDAVDVSGYTNLVATLYCPTKTGTPTTLDVKLQGSYDGTNFGDFVTAKAFTQITTTGTECLEVTNFGGKWIRAVGTMVGGSAGNGWTYSVLVHGKTET